MADPNEINRNELVEARERIQAQLEILQNPALARDRNPQLIARLEAMLNDIRTCLGETDLAD